MKFAFQFLLVFVLHKNIFVKKTKTKLNSDKQNRLRSQGPSLWLIEDKHVCLPQFFFFSTLLFTTYVLNVWGQIMRKMQPPISFVVSIINLLCIMCSVFCLWCATKQVDCNHSNSVFSVLERLFVYWSQISNFIHLWGVHGKL